MRAAFSLVTAVACCAGCFSTRPEARAQAIQQTRAGEAQSDLSDALSPAEWERVDRSLEGALEWLAQQQEPDGSFPTISSGQPAITSLSVMAYLACGHQPGVGRYGQRLSRAVDYVLECQQPSGLFSLNVPESQHLHLRASHTATYNHAIAGLMLCEVYGQVDSAQSARIAEAVNRALQMTGRIQVEPAKLNAEDQGGWRYLYRPGSFTPSDSDLSVTGWHLMFLRSAKNAQFAVPDKMVTEAVKYVERCFDEGQGGFTYGLLGRDRRVTRGMTGVGVLSLSLGGKHETAMARRAGEWLLEHPFHSYGGTVGSEDRFHYSAYYCSNAMAQLGGRYWRESFPILAKTMLDNQLEDGSWPPEIVTDGVFGPAYTTALTVLTLTPAYQMLPIYQR